MPDPIVAASLTDLVMSQLIANGPFGLFSAVLFCLYLMERKDRKSVVDDMKVLIERYEDDAKEAIKVQTQIEAHMRSN